jgi:hypothetical protein
MMIDKLVKSYVDHQEKKMNSISMVALVAKANILKVVNFNNDGLTAEQLKLLMAAVDDLNLIMNEYAKEDFKG